MNMTRRLGGLEAGVSDPFPFTTSHLQIALTSCTKREFVGYGGMDGGSVLSKYYILYTTFMSTMQNSRVCFAFS